MADIEQTIQNFYSVAQSKDFARKYQFRVMDITSPVAGTSFNQDDLVYVTAAQLPGKTINAVEVPYNGFKFRVPGTVEYTESDGYSITFYCDAQTSARYKLENWVEGTFSDETTTGDGRIHHDSNITLAQLDSSFSVINQYTLYGVFPTSVGALEYDITSDGEIVTLEASFAYQFFRRGGGAGRLI